MPKHVPDILLSPFEWVDIPAGKVTLEAGGYVPEGGQTFDVPAFQIAKHPITNGQFARFVEAGGYEQKRFWTEAGWHALSNGIDWDAESSLWKRISKAWTEPRYWFDQRWNGADYPVVGILWVEAVAFCRWLSDVSGEHIMLPTEQQWQRAAQGDDGRAYPWGNVWDQQRCNSKASSIGRTTPVTHYLDGASPYGVRDMSGNVWEFCVTDYETGSESVDEVSVCVLRGGSWLNDHHDLFRCGFRDGGNPNFWVSNRGFRVVRA